MADPNMSDFYRRVERIQKARAKGHGFEASGTLGRSFYMRQQTHRRGVLGPILFVCLAVVLLKGVMIHEIGHSQYDLRVQHLLASEGVAHLGGWLMQADPVSEMVADKLTTHLPTLR
jgi:hypothetical protein